MDQSPSQQPWIIVASAFLIVAFGSVSFSGHDSLSSSAAGILCGHFHGDVHGTVSSQPCYKTLSVNDET